MPYFKRSVNILCCSWGKTYCNYGTTYGASYLIRFSTDLEFSKKMLKAFAILFQMPQTAIFYLFSIKSYKWKCKEINFAFKEKKCFPLSQLEPDAVYEEQRSCSSHEVNQKVAWRKTPSCSTVDRATSWTKNLIKNAWNQMKQFPKQGWKNCFQGLEGYH